MKRSLKILAAALLLLGLTGCGENMIEREIEKSVAASLPETVGPADKYVVKASGSSLKMLQGRLNELDITGTNVKFAAGVKVQKLLVKIYDITFDTDTRKVTRVGKTNYSVALSQAELSRFASTKLPDIPELKIEIKNGLVGISAKPGISKLRMGVSATAAVQVVNQRILALDLKTLKVAGLNTPAFARELAESKMDQLFDANDLGFNATIESANLTPGTLTLSGQLDLIKLMQKASALNRPKGK